MKNFKILIFGLPGSGKTTLANKLAQKLGATHLNADEIREKYSDWDFSETGRRRQMERMYHEAQSAETSFVVMDFVCPIESYRKKLSADLTVFMDTLAEGRFSNTNLIFENPKELKPDYHFKIKASDEQSNIIAKSLITFDWRKPTVQMLGRWQPFHDGHLELFKRAISKTGQVVVQVRDCKDWQGSNPFSFEQTIKSINSKLSSNNFIEGKDYIIQLVPNITNITYGRDVGYKIEEEEFCSEITQISATKIRKSLGLR